MWVVGRLGGYLQVLWGTHKCNDKQNVRFLSLLVSLEFKQDYWLSFAINVNDNNNEMNNNTFLKMLFILF